MRQTSPRNPQLLLKLNCFLESTMNIIRLQGKEVMSSKAIVGVTEIGYRSLKFNSTLNMPCDRQFQVKLEIPLEKHRILVEGQLMAATDLGDYYEYEMLFGLEEAERMVWVNEIRHLALKQNYRFWQAWLGYGVRG